MDALPLLNATKFEPVTPINAICLLTIYYVSFCRYLVSPEEKLKEFSFLSSLADRKIVFDFFFDVLLYIPNLLAAVATNSNSAVSPTSPPAKSKHVICEGMSEIAIQEVTQVSYPLSPSTLPPL